LNRLTPLEALNLLAELKEAGGLKTRPSISAEIGQLLIVGFDGTEMSAAGLHSLAPLVATCGA